MAHKVWVAGEVIADRYRLQDPIGRGGMGEVWRAEHTRLRSPVAVKLLHEDVSHRPDLGERFLREAQACAAVRGPNIVEVLDVGVEAGTPYIAMELLVGESLARRLETQQRLTPAATVHILSRVARAIGRAHRNGIVHRDLKPANIHLVRDEDEPQEIVKVLDFGIAKFLHSGQISTAALTAKGAIVGTLHYMSPEQARGTREIDHRADLWSLAILGFQCITGDLPLRADTLPDHVIAIHTTDMPLPSSKAQGVPEAFDRWFVKGTKRAPDDRFQSAAEMAAELARAF